jgi:DNA-binding transcriptional LysR family regulator
MIINEMLLFYHVVQLNSFSQAAIKLGCSKSFISKHISQLEAQLKLRLINRNTRQFSLTEAGEIFYQHCCTLFDLVEQSTDSMAGLRNQPSGKLKISAPPAWGVFVLEKPLCAFSQAYPEVSLEVNLESHNVDIIQEGYDLALRAGHLADSGLIAQKLATFETLLCASPDYLKKHAPIKQPQQLKEHHFATYNSAIQQLKLDGGEEPMHITVDSQFRSNNFSLIVQMITAGFGIAALPDFLVKSALAQKKLVHCLPRYHLPTTPIYAVYPNRAFMPLKVKIFIETLKQYWQE